MQGAATLSGADVVPGESRVHAASLVTANSEAAEAEDVDSGVQQDSHAEVSSADTVPGAHVPAAVASAEPGSHDEPAVSRDMSASVQPAVVSAASATPVTNTGVVGAVGMPPISKMQLLEVAHGCCKGVLGETAPDMQPCNSTGTASEPGAKSETGSADTAGTTQEASEDPEVQKQICYMVCGSYQHQSCCTLECTLVQFCLLHL